MASSTIFNVFSRFCSSRSASTRRAPASDRAMAVARPMPLAAPVTTAVLPSTRNCSNVTSRARRLDAVDGLGDVAGGLGQAFAVLYDVLAAEDTPESDEEQPQFDAAGRSEDRRTHGVHPIGQLRFD